MDEYEASCLRVEKISTAVQCMKESLTCRICLELFDKPVTIKCGHKFCRECILKVTNNENPSCPFCNTKIQKRSIPKEGNIVLQASVKLFDDLVKAIRSDSGIDVLQPYNKIKDTKESTFNYEKPSTSKVQNTPSTSKASSSTVNPLNKLLGEPKVSKSIRSKLALAKKKTDIKSPSQSSEKNTLHKYLSNKSDPVPDQVIHSQEKVKTWLESCTSDENDSLITDSIQAERKTLKDSFTNDQITTPPDQIHCSPQLNKIEESDVSPVPPSEASSESKYKETQMRIQEAEMLAKKKKKSLSLKETNNLKRPSSVTATSHSDAYDWRRVKQVGREMQVKTFKTLNVSIEKSSPPVVLDDTVPYNSTNNDSKNISRDSETNNSSVDKTPLLFKKCDPLKSENNNLPKKSPQIIIEDYRHRSMDSTGSSKHEYVATCKVDENQLNEIIGVVPLTSVSKTPEKIRSPLTRSNVCSNFNQHRSLKNKSHSGQELSDYELSTCDSKTTVISLQNSPPKKSRLSLKSTKGSVNSKNSSPPGTSDKINEKEKQSLNFFSPEKPKSRLLLGSLQNKTNSITQKLLSTNPPLSDNLDNKYSSSSDNRIIFRKLGKICKKKQNVPFLYFGKLEKEKSIYFDTNSPCRRKPRLVIKSSVAVQIDYKSLMDDNNVANLEEFSSDELPSKIVSPKSNLQSRSATISSSTKNYEEAMNIDEDIDVNRPGQSIQQMEIDETLPPAKMIVKSNSDLEKRNSKSKNTVVEKKGDNCLRTLREKIENSKNTEFEDIPSQIDENVPKPFRRTYEDNMSKKSITEYNNCSPVSASSSKVDTVKKSSNFIQTKVLIDKNNVEKADVDRIPNDLISISSDDSEVRGRRKYMQEIRKTKKNNEPYQKIVQKRSKKYDAESCTESEVSVASSKRDEENIEDAKHRYSSTSSSSLKTVKKKRTHSESSNDDDVVNIIDKWFDNDRDQAAKKAKISLDSEEMVNVSKRRTRSKYSLNSSSDEEEETFKENKQQQNSLVDHVESHRVPDVKSQNTEASVNKLPSMPSSMLSADLFETNEQSIQPNAQVPKQQHYEIINKAASPTDSDAQSDKENRSERSRENITVIDARQLRRKSIPSKSIDIVDKENNDFERTPEYNKSVKATEEHVDEIESSQKEKDKTVDNFGHESNPYFGRDSLFNITQEQLAYKNIEKDLFGVDLSRIHENQNEDAPDSDKFSTPHRKPKSSEENDDFDSDNIAPTPVATRRRPAVRLPLSQSSPQSVGNASEIFSPGRKPNLIPAITPMKNTKSYPLCHSTPMINSTDSPENLIHSHIETIKMICSSLTIENTKLVQKFAATFNAQFQANFDMDVTHVVVKVDPETKAGVKTFKYIQGIAFKKHVVSFEWIIDCLAQNRLVDADDEKYDVLDPDSLESGSKRSRLSSQNLFENFAFCCLEPFQKVSLDEFQELLIYNGAVIVTSIREFHLHKDKLKVIIVGTDDLSEGSTAVFNKVEAAAVYFEWIVDSLSQFQILSLPSYLCETTIEKAKSLGFPPEFLVEEETLEEELDDCV